MSIVRNKPRIFVSSTVYDFLDLRSALKYWLEEMGFEVMMSEQPDFMKDSAINSYNTCLEAIANCDYYMLLIGTWVGGLYSVNPPISITQKEYQVANKLFEEGKLRKMLVFVRKNVWTVREDRRELKKLLLDEYVRERELLEIEDAKKISNHDSKFASDAEFIFGFIDEVSKSEQMKNAINGHSDYPKGNWINQFDSFNDIIQTLKIELLVKADLSLNRWIEVLFREFSNNLTQLLYKNDDQYMPYYTWVKSIRDKLPDNLNQEYNITVADGRKMATYGSMGISMKFLSSKMIEAAIQSGVFIRYDAKNQKCSQGNIQKALVELCDNIEFVKSIAMQIDGTSIMKFMQKLKVENPNAEEIICLNTNDTDILPIYTLHDSQYNICELIRYLFEVLQETGSKKYVYPHLYERGVFGRKNKQYLVDSEEIYRLFVHD